MSYKKIICKSYKRSKSENKDYCSHFSGTLETPSKCLIFFKTDIGRKGVWKSYRATTGNWYQIWIWFEGNLKAFRVQTDILAVVFDQIFKQQLNLLLFLSDRYCRNFGLTDLPGHDGKVTSNKKMIFFSHERKRVVIEITAAIFLWFLKQQVNFQIFFWVWYLEKRRLTELPGRDGKLTPDMNLIEDSFKGFRGQIEVFLAVIDWILKQ